MCVCVCIFYYYLTAPHLTPPNQLLLTLRKPAQILPESLPSLHTICQSWVKRPLHRDVQQTVTHTDGALTMCQAGSAPTAFNKLCNPHNNPLRQHSYYPYFSQWLETWWHMYQKAETCWKLAWGNSPVVQRLGLSPLAAKGQVQSLVWELRSHRPLWGAAKQTSKQAKNPKSKTKKLPWGQSMRGGEQVVEPQRPCSELLLHVHCLHETSCVCVCVCVLVS